MHWALITATFSWLFWVANGYRAAIQYLSPTLDWLFLGTILTLGIYHVVRIRSLTPVWIFLISIVPYLKYLFFIPFYGPVSFGGYDWHAYTLIAKLFSFRKAGSPLPIELENPVAIFELLERNVFGSYWPISTFQYFTNWSFPLAALLAQYLAYLQLNFIIHEFARKVFKLSNVSSLIILFILSINPYINFLLAEGYSSQIWGMGYAFAIFVCLAKINRWTWIPVGILLCGLSLTYSHMFAIVTLTCGLFFLREFNINSLKTSLRQLCANLGLAIGLCYVMSPYRQKLNLENFLLMKNVNAGPGMRSQYAESWLGFFFDPYFGKASVLIEVPITLIFLFALFKISIRYFKSKELVLAFLGISIMVGIYFGQIMMKMNNTPAVNYKHFKMISFFLPILLLYFWNYILVNKFKLHLKVFGLLLVLGNLINYGLFTREIINRNMSISKQTELLSEIKISEEKINIIAPESNTYDSLLYQQMFAAVYLSQNSMKFTNSFGPINAAELDGDYSVLIGIDPGENFELFNFVNSSKCNFSTTGLIYKKMSCETLKINEFKNAKFIWSKKDSSDQILYAITSSTPTLSR